MDKRSEKYQEVDLDTFQFWPGETCGCISSIGTIMNKEELRIMRGLHAEHWRPISPRSKFSSLYWTPLERGEGGEGEGHGASTDSVRRKPFATTLTDGLQTFQGQTHYHRPRTSKICLSQVMAFVIAALMVAWAPSVVGFNVDLKTAVVHEGPRDSMFGYAVAQHIDQSTNWVLIGAPKAQTSQAEIVRGGAVFRCKTDRARSCQEMPFDEDGNNVRYVPAINDYVPIEDKSNQWFGSTIQSSGENGVIVACAPRYVYFSDKLDKREPIGACYVARTSTTKYEKFSPCRSGGSGFNNQGYCQAGVSAALSKDGSRLLIGAPGSWYWQGQLFNYDTSDNRRIFAQTPEGQPDEDDTYMGYASAVGEFDGNSTFEEYVVGIPKGANSTGMVEIYTQNMTVIGSLRGEQIGSYFGSALAVLDVNADREDDIVVGAPFFGNVKGDEYESGRVYIYYQTKKVR
ncbi:integrin alpha-ps2 [Plakobranchus ocellatus]|uniref:Integrin alpha-ps2 n=1 Tax=Plakobranchus ocellatus TaxID=259542 RepID=A0AAV4B2L4_9GAST|nr:integrin alpha-ps2 [Plakobranchus ocellatus]